MKNYSYDFHCQNEMQKNLIDLACNLFNICISLMCEFFFMNNFHLRDSYFIRLGKKYARQLFQFRTRKLRDFLPRVAPYNYVIIVSHDIVHRSGRSD